MICIYVFMQLLYELDEMIYVKDKCSSLVKAQ